MLLQFQTLDEKIWLVDTAQMQWAEVSAPGTDPESKVVAHGKLVPMGFGIYRTEGLQHELASIGVYVVGIGITVKIFIRANIPIKDFTMPVPIRQVLYEILPTDPKQIENSIQEAANGDTKQIAQGPEEPKVSGDSQGSETQTEQSASEAEIQLGNGQVG